MRRLAGHDDPERFAAEFSGSEQDRESREIRIALAALRLAQHDPDAATAALGPVLDGSASVPPWTWLVHAFMLEATARDALGDPAAAGRAMERAHPHPPARPRAHWNTAAAPGTKDALIREFVLASSIRYSEDQ